MTTSSTEGRRERYFEERYLPCRHCLFLYEKHVEGKCLFGAQHYASCTRLYYKREAFRLAYVLIRRDFERDQSALREALKFLVENYAPPGEWRLIRVQQVGWALLPEC